MLVKFKSLDNWSETNKRKFSKGRRFGALTMCRKCYTFYYKHSWHFYKPEQLDNENDSIVAVHFTQCPACIEEELAAENRELDSEEHRQAELNRL